MYYIFSITNVIITGKDESLVLSVWCILCYAQHFKVSQHTKPYKSLCSISSFFLQEYITGSPVPRLEPASSPPLATSSSAPAGWTQCASPAVTPRCATGPRGNAPCPLRQCRAWRCTGRSSSSWPSSCHRWRTSRWLRSQHVFVFTVHFFTFL